MKPKLHAEFIKAWADGYEIECYSPEHGAWVAVAEPGWFENVEYRVKPGVIRAPRITEVCVLIDMNPFTGDPEMHTSRWRDVRNNVIMRFEDDDLVSIDMIGDLDEDPLPWE